MTRSEVEAFFAAGEKILVGQPEWRNAQRNGERRAYMPIAVDGILSKIQMSVTVYLNDPSYLVVMLIAPPCICRLCLTGAHRDRATGETVTGTHFHSWEHNKPKGQKLLESLQHLDPEQPQVTDRDAAIAWFLQRNDIQPLAVNDMGWPLDQGFF